MLIAAEILATLVAVVSFLCIPRRPEVVLHGKHVDAQYTASALGRFAFAWAAPILSYATKNRSLDLKDLPVMAQFFRAQSLHQNYNRLKDHTSLSWKLFHSFRWAFVKQFCLTVGGGIAQFVPHLAMYQLLKLLEHRQEGASVASVAWAWVLGLGGAQLLSSWIESWLFFTIWADLGIPVLSMLSILTFSKASRRMDVKDTCPRKVRTTVTNAGAGKKAPENELFLERHTVANEEDLEERGNSEEAPQQDTINLIAIDAKRVADFCSSAYLLPGKICLNALPKAATNVHGEIVVKLTISMAFLYALIGWQSLLAGIGASLVSLPLNVWVSRKYSLAQSGLMKYRDQKLSVVTEALHCIRQIKVSAMERQWLSKIEIARGQEMHAQKIVFQLNVVLLAVWIFGPVVLSAVCLAVYSWLNGTLSPSIAFTAIAILVQIEAALAVAPELATEILNAWVSVKRIEKYLNGPEKTDFAMSGDAISFENASIAWPAETQSDEHDRFVLGEININFPNKELSVIFGRTGSGKSLLLASIIGEVDRLSGIIRTPRAPSFPDRWEHKANYANWIIGSSIAFVAQVPWLENATIKDNILFGLPLDAARFSKVLDCCALRKDLETLPDGDLTDVGANGVNLSGGQKWRLSFARALYSRAEILILDDIFSAVDAHVGKHLFENALTGELGAGRTRILVTHHLSLCLPRSTYVVHLEGRRVEYAGFVEDLRHSDRLEKFLRLEKGSEEETPTKKNSAIGDEKRLFKPQSRPNTMAVETNEGRNNAEGKAPPRKFMDDEKRETGSVKGYIYLEYLSASGGVWMWLLLIAFYTGFAGMLVGRSWWITVWTRSYQADPSDRQRQSNRLHLQNVPNALTTYPNYHENHGSLLYYLGVYFGLSLIIVILGTVRFGLTFLACFRASQCLFRRFSHAVLHAPLRWFDVTPVGRILNRFTADFAVLDSRLAVDIGSFCYLVRQKVSTWPRDANPGSSLDYWALWPPASLPRRT